jgi:3-hydroxybutyryl-CoA dehydratase
MALLFDELREGLQLPEVKKAVSQQNINLYAEASRDFNPVHINEEFAKKTPLGGTVAHGMLILAYISEMMTNAFGENWISGGRLDVRFKAAARPGDTITASGKVMKIEKNGEQTRVRCSVTCSNEKGEVIITGEAVVSYPDRG